MGSPLASAGDPSRQPIVPRLFGNGSFGRIFAALIAFELTALAGEWVVHQIEYLLVYGGRFGAVMYASPHRYYMGPLGLAFALLFASSALTFAVAVRVRLAESTRLLALLPLRLRNWVLLDERRTPLRSVLRTALVLFCLQAIAYLLQENLEPAVQELSVPGLTVLYAGLHLSVLPLHFAVAFSASLVLWTVADLSGRTERLLAAVRRLVRLFVHSTEILRGIAPSYSQPVIEPALFGARSLRSPPFERGASRG